MLCGINELFGLPLSFESLLSLGSILGADVPFCIACGTACAESKGDKLYQIDAVENCYFVIACGGEGVSTPWAYKELDMRFDNFSQGVYLPKDITVFKKRLESGEFLGVYNIFEEVILPARPVARQIKKILGEQGATCALMSGSGPSVFGVFENRELAEKASGEIASLGYFAHVATPITKNF